MKKLCSIILFVFLLPVTSSFAATGQQILIPYAQSGNGYWSGVAIHNTSDSSMTFILGAYESNGTWVSGSSQALAAHVMRVHLVENFFSGMQPSGRMSV